MDIATSNRVWADSSLSTSEKMVLLALDHLSEIDPDGFSWYGYEKLAEITGINLESKYLTKLINKLQEKGYILIWRQHGRKGGRGYTHIYWPIIGRTDDQILETIMRRFIATEEEARAIISQVGPIYDDLIKRNRVSGKTLEDTRAIKKGVPKTPIDNKGYTDNTQSDDIGVPETPIDEDDGKKGVLETPRLLVSSNPESSPKKESLKVLSPPQILFLALADLCHIELRAASEKQKGQLGKASKALVNLVTDHDQFKAKFPIYWAMMDWRGQKGQSPDPPQIQEAYGDYCHWLQNGEKATIQPTKNGANHYGSHQRSNEKPTGESLEGEPTYDTSTKELVYPDGRRVPY